MAERWRYAQSKHPPYCTCVQCKNDGSAASSRHSSNQLRSSFERWRSRGFDPHYILGVPPNSSRDKVIAAHRRKVRAYHPDKHKNDPLATELTKRVNAARDELLGRGPRRSTPRPEQKRSQSETKRQRARDAENRQREEARKQRACEAQRWQYEERRARAREAEQRRMQEEARRQGVFEAERLMSDAARRNRSRTTTRKTRQRRRVGSPIWASLAIGLAIFIVTYLVLTVESPDAVDSLMHSWARLFDQALARQS